MNTSSGVAQVNFGLGPRQGNLQLYTSKFGLLQGNARINVGDPGRLKELRSILLKSPWFIDVVDGKGASAVYGPEGAAVLPQFSQTSTCSDIKKMLQSIRKKLGPSGREAMAKYLSFTSLPPGCEAEAVLQEVFGLATPAAGDDGSGKKKKQRKD